MYHYLFRTLCFEYRVMSVQYFLDDAQLYEFDDAIDYVQYSDRSLWETARLQTYVEAQVHSKKSLEMTDLLKFPWEDTKSIQKTDISKAEIKRLKEKAAKVEKMLQDGKIFNIRD